MTIEDIKNLNLVLKKLNEIASATIKKLVELTGLDKKLISERLMPKLFNKDCINRKQITHNTYNYWITDIGKEYLADNIFQKEYEQEERFNKEVKLLDWRIKTYRIHWGITILAFLMSAYLFVLSLIEKS